jgi:hypothetical protein
MKKRVLCLLLSFVMALGLLPGMSLTVLAETDSVASVNSTEYVTEYVNFDQAVRDWKQTDSATLKLLKDVNTAEAISVSGKKTLTLDLNGHSFTGNVNVISSDPSVTDACFTITDSSNGGSIEGALTVSGAKAAMDSGSIKGGVQIQNAGEFTLNGGTIVGCALNGADIKNGTFTMNGGTIKDNTGAGVALSAENSGHATFTMSGGEITGNTIGVLVSESNSSNPGVNVFKLEGSPRILGNVSNDVACNVKLEGDALIHIIGKLKKPVGAVEPQIGVTKPINQTDVVFTKDYTTHNPGVDPAVFFKSDIATVKLESGKIGNAYVCWNQGENADGTGPFPYSSGEAARLLHTHVWEPVYQYAISIDENFGCTSRHQENLFSSACMNALANFYVLKHGICPYCPSCTLTLNVQSKKYDGVPVVATLTPSEGWKAEKPWDYDASKIDYFKKDGTALSGAPKDVGDYIAKYKLDVDGSWTPGEMTMYFCISTGFKIEKADVSITAPMARELTYDGSKQELVTAGSTSNGTLYYAVTTNNTAPDASLYTTFIPTADDAGTYYVWYMVEGDSNHNDTVPAGPITVTIAEIADGYSIRSVQGGEHILGDNRDAVFTVTHIMDDNRPFERFGGVSVGGKDVVEGNYTRASGSLVLTLKSAYLNTLAAGDYPVRIAFTDGHVDSSLKILDAEPTPTVTPNPTAAPDPTATPNPTAAPDPTATPRPVPATGDLNHPVVWLILVLIGAAGLAALTALKALRKR